MIFLICWVHDCSILISLFFDEDYVQDVRFINWDARILITFSEVFLATVGNWFVIMFIDGFIRFNGCFNGSGKVEAGSISLMNRLNDIAPHSHVGCFDNSYGSVVQLEYWGHKWCYAACLLYSLTNFSLQDAC
jgi:hypothetical protein